MAITITGTITCDGNPLAGVVVHYEPDSGGPQDSDTTDANGHYSVTGGDPPGTLTPARPRYRFVPPYKHKDSFYVGGEDFTAVALAGLPRAAIGLGINIGM